jgi:ornithine cyclodeaminase/alanine dehydrogenase-like protein (mu-crystallin family)
MPLVDLAAIVTGRAPGRRSSDEITMYCSVGLAGTEVALAARLLDERHRV